MKSQLDNFLEVVAAHDGAAHAQTQTVKKLGLALVESLRKLIGNDRFSCWLCPPDGAFSCVEKLYRDAAFSYHQAPLLLLEPVTFGVALAFPFRDKPDKRWALRLVLSAECAGDEMQILLLDDRDMSRPDMTTDLPDPPQLVPLMRIPTDFGTADVDRVAVQLFDAVTDKFGHAVRRYKDGGGQQQKIGFALAT